MSFMAPRPDDIDCIDLFKWGINKMKQGFIKGGGGWVKVCM